MSTANHNMLYFAAIFRTHLLNTGHLPVESANRALLTRVFCPAFRSKPAPRAEARRYAASLMRVVLLRMRFKAQKRCRMAANLCELWTFGLFSSSKLVGLNAPALDSLRPWPKTSGIWPTGGAAKRLCFTFEGVFHQHMIVKGRNRDTAWYPKLDRDWPAPKRAFETWFAPGNFDDAGRQRKRLEDLVQGGRS